MRWRTGRRSTNIEDRRGMGGGLGGGGLPLGRGGIAGGGIGLVAIILIGLFLGIDPTVLLQGGGTGSEPSTYQSPQGQGTSDEQRDFVAVVLADTEDTWKELFRERGGTYQEPTLVLFNGAVQSACGFAQAAVGPFYCPADHKVYIDLGFYDDLARRFGAPGDFAQAYVIAHEIGHHVQTLLGISSQVEQAAAGLGERDQNELSVRQELQADCFAGIWAHHADRTRQILEEGDIEEALTAASAIGDDRLQQESQGYVVPDAFTHGTSAQRVRWFRRGLDSGTLESCDTFKTDQL